MKTKMLADHLSERANNFTLLRLLLAWLVLYGHSYAIAPVPGIRDPLTVFFQSTWIGELAVNGFFAISGLLIAKSFVDRGLGNYIISRVLRIMPAIVVCIFVSVFIFGAMFTTLSVAEYFDHPNTWSYLKNAYLPDKVQWVLPGVFETHPGDVSMNGSLWTLSTEVRCYALCAILGVCGAFHNRTITALIAGLLVYLTLTDWSMMPLLGGHSSWARPATYFLAGCLAYQWRDEIPIHLGLFVLGLVIFVLVRGTAQFQVLIIIPLTYAVYFVAFGLPHFDLDKRLGDISYGVYIYAFPVQQMVKATFPEQGPYFNCLVATPIVLIFGYASWRIIEKPALSLKRPIMTWFSSTLTELKHRALTIRSNNKIWATRGTRK